MWTRVFNDQASVTSKHLKASWATGYSRLQVVMDRPTILNNTNLLRMSSFMRERLHCIAKSFNSKSIPQVARPLSCELQLADVTRCLHYAYIMVTMIMSQFCAGVLCAFGWKKTHIGGSSMVVLHNTTVKMQVERIKHFFYHRLVNNQCVGT